MSAGFLGTRGDFIVDSVMTISGALPFLLLFTFYLAAKGQYELHKNLQMLLLGIVILLVIALELDVQTGGLSAVSKQSPYAGTPLLTTVFLVHLFFAVSSLLVWFWLIAKSIKRYPKFFEFDHKKWGKILFADILFMAITGWILYWMTFGA